MLGITPAPFASGIGSDIQRPLATVIFGGLISTLFLTLLGMPGLCYLAKGVTRTAGAETGGN
jgi:cobalt-zinc-cadmium resistance protein CzcA